MFKRRLYFQDPAETLTVGDYFRRRREEEGFSIKEVSDKLGIRKEYMESLESGNYGDLPPQVYVRGFIKSYSELLGIDGNQLIKIYNREISSADGQIKEEKKKGFRRKGFNSYLAITPGILTLVASIAVISVIGYYFYHQINSFNSKPYLFLESPQSDEVVKQNELWVTGKTEEDAVLKINGQAISVGSDGRFSEKITLSEGKNRLVVEAKNRFNNSDRREITVIYEKPAQGDKTITETVDPGNILGASDVDAENADGGKNGDAAKNSSGGKDSAASLKNSGKNPDTAVSGTVQKEAPDAAKSAPAVQPDSNVPSDTEASDAKISNDPAAKTEEEDIEGGEKDGKIENETQ